MLNMATDKENLVVLCSGGFDSITLLHYMQTWEDMENTQIHVLFFNYGQPNYQHEWLCTQKVCEKLGLTLHKIHLPEFEWTKGKFYERKTLEDKYLEYRNLIFLSYAMSFAQSIDSKEIYCGIFCPPDCLYDDASREFLCLINALANLSGIGISAPFRGFTTKAEVVSLAYKSGVTTGEWWSCDTPTRTNGCNDTDCEDCPWHCDPCVVEKPCGKCEKCEMLREVEELLKIPVKERDDLKPLQEYLDNFFSKPIDN